MGVMDRIWDEVFAGPLPQPLTAPSSQGPPPGTAWGATPQAPPFSASSSTSAVTRPIPNISPHFRPSFGAKFHPSLTGGAVAGTGAGSGAAEASPAGAGGSLGGAPPFSLAAMNGAMGGTMGGAAGTHRKLQSSLSIELPGSSRGALDCTDALLSPSPAPSPHPNSADRRASTDFRESRSVRGASTRGQGIHIGSVTARRASLDSARSLPAGFGFLPDILSPGSRARAPAGDKSLRPTASDPLPTTQPPAAAPGGVSARLDRGGSKGRAVYDWYNPL